MNKAVPTRANMFGERIFQLLTCENVSEYFMFGETNVARTVASNESVPQFIVPMWSQKD